MKRLKSMFALLTLASLSACGTLSSAAPTVTLQISAVEQSLHSYCEIAGPSDPEIAKICDYATAGVLAADAAVSAILNVFRARAARTVQAKAAAAGGVH